MAFQIVVRNWGEEPEILESGLNYYVAKKAFSAYAGKELRIEGTEGAKWEEEWQNLYCLERE